ncbi:MAG: polysaccharide deacetylase family protein [unclassified Hahellaceae]|nr:polysaccharide deacetylase family protein [Hahellaceae bacterium]|tara:strand:+ start:38452 stop:39318 length:867 start_codon:yes stop_codon:yes gene_type:complete
MITNAMTIDVEDYFHVAALAESIKVDEWDAHECRVEANTDALLALFDEKRIKSTFFVLGWVAERYPDLVKRIAAAGHEVASHGFSHQLVYKQTPEVFRDETRRSKDLLESLIQAPVDGYRAASYSITAQSRWALDILVELGFVWDSSIFPVNHDRYGMPGTPELPYRLKTDNGGEIIEFPLSTAKLLGRTIPIAGGGYFRLFPYWFSRWGLGSINRKQEPFIFYLHPWEIDTEQPRVKASAFSMFRHYNNLDKCMDRLRNLTDDFQFSTVGDVLRNKQLLPAEPRSGG